MTSYVDIFGNQTVPPSEAAYIRHTIAANGQLVWPYNFGGDDLLTADITEIDATVGSLVVTLPPATEVSVGQDILIRNVGANAFDIVDFASGAVTTVPTGASKYLFVTDNSTEAGVWGLFTYGTGTSGADASLLAGEGLQAISNQLQVYAPYRGVNSSQSLVVGDRASVIEVVAGSLTLTLPQASVATDGYYVFIRNSSAGSTTIEGFGTEQIDGTLNKVLAPNESAIFVCNGTYWITVGFGRDATFVFSEVVVNAALTNITLSSADVAGRMIRVSGTATGNVTVTLPAVDNIYFVNVETGLGGFNCTFTTGSGATVVMLANQKTVLYCDGTNVSTAITTSVISTLSLNDGSAGAPVVTFALDTDTGFYRSGSGAVGFTSNAVNTVTFNNNGIAFTPVGNIAANNVAGALAEIDGDVTTVSNGLAAHIADAVDAHDASAISNVPAGSIAATDVQAALNEIDSDLTAHINDATDAHDASAISNVPAGSIAATDVQAAINELDTEKAPLASPTFTGTVSVPTISISGNAGFTGTGNRITGDFSNGTVANRVMFQTSTLNGNTTVAAIPVGTGTQAAFLTQDSQGPNASVAGVRVISGTESRFESSIQGAGAQLPMTFHTNALERMRVSVDGTLLFNTTSSTGMGGFSTFVGVGVSTSNFVHVSRNDSGSKLLIQDATNRAGTYVSFGSGTTTTGSISTNGTTTTYSTSSDYRLKENVRQIVDYEQMIMALRPVEFTWKSDGSIGRGFIAHELKEIFPQAVAGEKDDTEEDGTPKYQGIDVSFLVADLVAFVQSQQKMIKKMADRISYLERK